MIHVLDMCLRLIPDASKLTHWYPSDSFFVLDCVADWIYDTANYICCLQQPDIVVVEDRRNRVECQCDIYMIREARSDVLPMGLVSIARISR